MVRRRAGRLYDEDVVAAHVLIDLNERLTVREARDRRLPEWNADGLADFFRESAVRVTREDF